MNFKALSLLCFVFLVLGVPGAASAQVKSPGPYVSEMRDQCIAELQKDAEIQVACMTQYSNEFHEQDSRQATKNKKHVIMAYAALWGIVAIFVTGLWIRQRKLSAEITRLEFELKKAATE